MLVVRKAKERGPTRLGWLDSQHSFSFGGYQDPRHTGFRDLLVINEDRVKPGAGFGRHGHADMEILSYVLDGALAHKDSTGTDGVIRVGEIQRMSAGTGIQHSEMNASADTPVHFLQIWIKPAKRGIDPGYEQVAMAPVTQDAQLDLIAGPHSDGGSVTVHADARVYRASLKPFASTELPLAPNRHAWIQVARGAAAVNGQILNTGDGLAASDEAKLTFVGGEQPAELLVFDLA